MFRIAFLVVHCSATPNGDPRTVEDIRRWHTDPKPRGNGWLFPGYHSVIEINGYIATLLRQDMDAYLSPGEIANGALGFNDRALHVCLIGTDRFTAAQWLALTSYVRRITATFPLIRVVGHRELNPNKSCPGFDVAAWIAGGYVAPPQHLFT